MKWGEVGWEESGEDLLGEGDVGWEKMGIGVRGYRGERIFGRGEGI